MEPQWLRWARELQAIAQTGLHFTQSEYDRERYQRVRLIAVEMLAQHSGEEPKRILELFTNQDGYATPKVDVRGVAFRDRKILLVQERQDRLWTLPGGWADVNDSPSEAVVREIREESGFEAKAMRLLAVFDRAKHQNDPPFPFHVYKLFVLCDITGSAAQSTAETIAVGFFGLDELPPLSRTRTSRQQIEYCFRAADDPSMPVAFD
jgi:ADP-ribose pyrophosphatase YjhB (NUDIX family)